MLTGRTIQLKIISRLKAVIWFLARQAGIVHTKAPYSEQLIYNCYLYNEKDVTPQDKVSDEVACAEVISTLLSKVIPYPIIPGTWILNDFLANDKRFKRVGHPITNGVIVISATGTGNGSMRGHVGIFEEDGTIWNNNSYDGKLRNNYTLAKWIERYNTIGGMPVLYYKLVE